MKNNTSQYWFRRKLYGWGWTPATWQGWLTLGVFLAVYAWMLVDFLEGSEPENNEVMWFLAKVFAWVAVLILVCWKTGESPKWQWGVSEDKKESLDE